MLDMYTSSKRLKYLATLTVSLIAISTATQANAQCAPAPTTGDDTIICSGTITGPINLLAGNDTLTNSGALTGGITAQRGTNTITNTATGEISGVTAINGVSSDALNLDNSGTITGTAVGVSTDNGAITNQVGAMISGSGTSEIQGAVLLNDGNAIINNSGNIQNTAGRAIAFSPTGSGFSGAINNLSDGVIGGDLHGIGYTIISSTRATNGSVTNAGTIEGTTGSGISVISNGFGSSTGSTSAAGFSSLINTGTIRGGTGISVQAVAPFNEAFISSINNNGGVIEGTGGTAIQFTDITGISAINIAGDSDPLLGRIIGDVIDNNPMNGFSPVTITGSDFDTEGNFTVSSLTVNAGQEFRISAGNDFNTGSVALNAGSTINIGLDDVMGSLAVGELNVTNGAIDLSSGSVGAEVTANANNLLMDGQQIQVGTGTAALIGTDGNTGQALTTVTDTSALFDFAIADGGQTDITAGGADNTDLFFVVSQAATASTTAITSNANSAGGAIDTFISSGTSNPELSSVVSNVSSASSAAEVEEILQAVLPQVDRGGFMATQTVSGNTIRLVSDRLTTIRGTGDGQSGISSGDTTKNLQAWGQFFGQAINQGERSGVAGFDANTFGFTLGADTTALMDKGTLGVSFTYANTDIDSDSTNNTQTDIDSFSLSFYGDYDLTDTTHLVGSLGYTYGDNDATRFNVGGVSGLNANGDFSSNQIEARLIGVQDYNLSKLNGVKLSSRVQAHYIYYDAESFTETGAGGANLSVENDALNVLEFGVGFNARKDYVQAGGAILSPEVSAGYRYDVIGDAINTTSTFSAGGPSFTSEGADPAQGTLNLGFGLGYTTPDDWELTASYDYETRDDFNSHSGLIRAAYRF